MRVDRVGRLIRPNLDGRMGSNINGPSLIRVPDWVVDPLGRYYLYFAAHVGSYIRLAYAHQLLGPWQTYEPGALDLRDSHFPTRLEPPDDPAIAVFLDKANPCHIASPDVIVDPASHTVRMYFHGLLPDYTQQTRVAVSRDGLDWDVHEELIVPHPYLRVFRHGDEWYGLAMPGTFYRSPDGLTGWERGPTLFEPEMRHAAVILRGNRLHVLWSRVGDAPERLLSTTIDIGRDWATWEAGPSTDLLRPEEPWEGADLPVDPSVRGAVDHPVNQLRDPGVLDETGRTWLVYAVAGEAGLALAELGDL